MDEQRKPRAPGPPRRKLPPQALRTLAEARERRTRAETAAARGGAPAGKGEVGGPKGPEPTRYGDWERKGIASDF